MVETADYCRQVETYLCQKNGGHLVRIVGPAFTIVRGWAEQGVPLKVALRGIDRTCERANARGGRRRPLRIEFCEADVLDVFDDWRRAIGLNATRVAEEAGSFGTDDGDAGPVRPGGSRKGPLAAHIQRCVSRLLAPKTAADPAYDAVVARVTAALDELAAPAATARGDARAGIVARLAALDDELLEAARQRVDARLEAALRAEADVELAGFAGRMPADQLARARQRAVDRLTRDAFNLPVLTFD
jgi:hypothetical protein